MMKSLPDSDMMFRNVFDAIQDAICILDPDLIIVQANLAAERWFPQGTPLVGKKCYQAIRGRSKPCSDCPSLRALKLQSHQVGVAKEANIEGITKWYELHAFPLLNKEEQVTGVIHHIRDATVRVNAERKQLEAGVRIARAEKISSLAALVAGITHEVSQPLNAIKVLTDGMLYWFQQGRMPEPDEIKAKLKRISDQADRASQIIKYVRSLIRDEQPPDPMVPCNLNQVVGRALGLVDSQLRAHGIIIKKSLADSLPPILGDRMRLEEVMINLLINSMQALDDVTLKEKEIVVKTQYEKNNVIVEISDNGSGLDEGITDKLFEPFVTTKSARGGMGLGLSYVYSIVEAHNARIEGRNNDYRGATFRLEFPVTSLPGGGRAS